MHNMYSFGLDKETDVLTLCDEIGCLDHPLEAADINDDLPVNTLEGNRRDGSLEHTLVGRYNVDVLGTNDYVNKLILAVWRINVGKSNDRHVHLTIILGQIKLSAAGRKEGTCVKSSQWFYFLSYFRCGHSSQSFQFYCWDLLSDFVSCPCAQAGLKVPMSPQKSFGIIYLSWFPVSIF